MDSETMIRFIYLGNLLIEKGPLVLLEACRILKERDISFSCDIVGAPTAEITMKYMRAKIQEYGLADCVLLRGAQYGQDKEQLLNQADVMVFPTFYHNECFPLVLLEGMKHSLAIISTAEGAIPDIVADGETGLLTKKQNPVSLAAAMEQLISSPGTISRLASAAHLLYNERFSEAQFISRMQDILRNA